MEVIKNKYTEEQIKDFLQCIDGLFPVPLSRKQDLSGFAKKLYEKATICAVDDGKGKIFSMTAGYTKNLVDQIAYISIVATLPKMQGKGYGKRLVEEFLSIAKKQRLRAVHLNTVESNAAALRMYQELGFEKWNLKEEVRPQDVHLIYKIEV